MDVLEAALLKELMSSVSQVVTDAHDRGDQLGAASQMSLGAEELVCVALRGKGVLVSWGIANQLALVDSCGADLNLEGLACSGAADQLSCDRVAGSNFGGFEVFQVWDVSRDNNLHAALTTTIVQFNEEEVFTTDSG